VHYHRLFKSLRFKGLIAFFRWLSFQSQLCAAPTGHVIVALKDLGKLKFTLERSQTPGSRVV